MGIHIGDNNKIKNSNISENLEILHDKHKENFFNKHPWICSIIASVLAGLILMFSFWEKIISIIGGIF